MEVLVLLCCYLKNANNNLFLTLVNKNTESEFLETLSQALVGPMISTEWRIFCFCLIHFGMMSFFAF